MARGPHLGEHAAAPPFTDATTGGLLFEHGIAGLRLVNQLGIGMPVGIAVIHALLIGENHQYVRLDEVGHKTRQGVIVAEADLLHGHRVVFIDHRHHPKIQ